MIKTILYKKMLRLREKLSARGADEEREKREKKKKS
jgi:hypothetical protein